MIVDARVRACVKAAFEEREGRSEEIEGSVVQFFVEARSEFCRNFCSRLFATEKKKKNFTPFLLPRIAHTCPPFPPAALASPPIKPWRRSWRQAASSSSPRATEPCNVCHRRRLRPH